MKFKLFALVVVSVGCTVELSSGNNTGQQQVVWVDAGDVDAADGGGAGAGAATGGDAATTSADTAQADAAVEDAKCVPACAGKECGPDGCGGSCGQCDVLSGEPVCYVGKCVAEADVGPSCKCTKGQLCKVGGGVAELWCSDFTGGCVLKPDKSLECAMSGAPALLPCLNTDNERVGVWVGPSQWAPPDKFKCTTCLWDGQKLADCK